MFSQSANEDKKPIFNSSTHKLVRSIGNVAGMRNKKLDPLMLAFNCYRDYKNLFNSFAKVHEVYYKDENPSESIKKQVSFFSPVVKNKLEAIYNYLEKSMHAEAKEIVRHVAPYMMDIDIHCSLIIKYYQREFSKDFLAKIDQLSFVPELSNRVRYGILQEALEIRHGEDVAEYLSEIESQMIENGVEIEKAVNFIQQVKSDIKDVQSKKDDEHKLSKSIIYKAKRLLSHENLFSPKSPDASPKLSVEELRKQLISPTS